MSREASNDASGVAAAPTGATRVAAVVGSPIAHSLSPKMYNAAFASLGMDWVFVAFQAGAGDAAGVIGAMRVLGLAGLSVTMPLKAAVIEHLDVLTDDAAALGAVNAIAWDDGALVGHNTDGGGFVDALEADHQVAPRGLRFAVVGAGGAARAVCRGVASAGAADVVVVNRSASPAEAAAAAAGSVGRVGVPDDITAADVVVQATSVGMEGVADGALPIEVALLRPEQILVELVYQPRATPLLLAARARGLRTSNGVGMLAHQGARQFLAWTGRPAPLDVLVGAVTGS